MNSKKVIAVCGKGGVGKTAFTAMLTKLLQEERPGKLLVVDADPALGLIYALERKSDKTIGAIRDKVIKTAEEGNRESMTALADKIDYLVAQALDEGQDFSCLAMGRMDRVGCFCSINSLLKQALNEVSNEFDTILIDGEAGLEQINRQVVETVDTLIIVTDTSLRGLKTVEHIKGMVDEGLIPSCTNVGVVFNRIRGDITPLKQFVHEHGLKVFGSVPYDKTVEEFDLAGKSLMKLDSGNAALSEIRKALADIL